MRSEFFNPRTIQKQPCEALDIILESAILVLPMIISKPSDRSIHFLRHLHGNSKIIIVVLTRWKEWEVPLVSSTKHSGNSVLQLSFT